MKVDGGFGAARTARSVEPKRRVVAMSPRRFGLARLAREFLLEVQHAFRAARSARDVSGYGAVAPVCRLTGQDRPDSLQQARVHNQAARAAVFPHELELFRSKQRVGGNRDCPDLGGAPEGRNKGGRIEEQQKDPVGGLNADGGKRIRCLVHFLGDLSVSDLATAANQSDLSAPAFRQVPVYKKFRHVEALGNGEAKVRHGWPECTKRRERGQFSRGAGSPKMAASRVTATPAGTRGLNRSPRTSSHDDLSRSRRVTRAMCMAWPARSATTLPIRRCPRSDRSPMRSRTLCRQNSFGKRRPSGFNSPSRVKTMAFSSDP